MAINKKLLVKFNQLVGLGPAQYRLMPILGFTPKVEIDQLMPSSYVSVNEERLEKVVSIAVRIQDFLSEAGVKRYLRVGFVFSDNTVLFVSKTDKVSWKTDGLEIGESYEKTTLFLGFFPAHQVEAPYDGILEICHEHEMAAVVHQYPVYWLEANQDPKKNPSFRDEYLTELAAFATRLTVQNFLIEPILRLGARPGTWVNPRFYSLYTDRIHVFETTVNKIRPNLPIPMFVTYKRRDHRHGDEYWLKHSENAHLCSYSGLGFHPNIGRVKALIERSPMPMTGTLFDLSSGW